MNNDYIHLASEIERFEFAYRTGLESDIQPISREALKKARDLFEECDMLRSRLAAAGELAKAAEQLMMLVPLGPLDIAAKYGPDVDPDKLYSDTFERAAAALAKFRAGEKGST